MLPLLTDEHVTAGKSKIILVATGPGTITTASAAIIIPTPVVATGPINITPAAAIIISPSPMAKDQLLSHVALAQVFHKWPKKKPLVQLCHYTYSPHLLQHKVH